jgi:hypothetical protein
MRRNLGTKNDARQKIQRREHLYGGMWSVSYFSGCGVFEDKLLHFNLVNNTVLHNLNIRPFSPQSIEFVYDSP